MKHKKILIAVTGVLALAGFTSLLIHNNYVYILYIVVSSLLLAAVSFGGLIDYNSQHMQDFREIYREKHAMSLEEISRLKYELKRIGEIKNP